MSLAVAALAAVALGRAPTARADGPPPPVGRVAVVAEPRAVSPRDRSVRIRLDGCEGQPVVAASVGKVGAVAVVAPGRAAAEYVPPPEARPQVAIVTASCGDRHGWTALPIVGRGVAIARTAPGASIRVTIGTRSFGPAVADGTGTARVLVEVPPGIGFAYQGEKALDLRVPPAPHVHVTVDRPLVRADREESLRILAFAVTPAGAPRQGAPLRLSVSDGVLSEPVELEPGLSVARWTLPAGRAGRARVEARLEDDPGVPATAEVERRAGPPARIAAAADRAVAVAGEAPVQLDVNVVDAAGNPTASDLRIEPDAGVLERREIAPGRWAIGLDVPERLDGRAALDLSIAAGGAGSAARVPLAPAPAVTLAVEPGAAGELVADGRTAVSFHVAARDRFGNAAAGATPTAAMREAADVSTAPDGDGFRVTVRPRRRLTSAEDAVTITAGGRTERLPVSLRGADPLVDVAARAGFLASTGALRSPYAGVEASLWPWGRHGLSIEAGVFGDARRDRLAVAGAELALRGEVRYLPVILSSRWRTSTSRRTALLAGGGVVVAAVHGEAQVAGQPAVREDGVAAGGQLSFGVGRRVGPGAAFVEARGLWIADAGIEPVHGRVLALGLLAGWSHGLR